MGGWIKLNRSIQSHWIYNERRKFSKLEAWIDMLMTANYADNKVIIKGKLYEVKRGESINSMDTWAKRWSWDKSAVRRFLTLLQNDNIISIKSDSITTHLTICKYESYQGEKNANETQMKRRRNADEYQTTPIEEGKEIKEGKEGNTCLTFESFWELYDKKVDSKKCKDKFNKVKESDRQKILDTLPTYIKSTPDIKFRKNPSTYLNNECWNDTVEIIESTYPKTIAEEHEENMYKSSLKLVERGMRTPTEHNEVMKTNKMDIKYYLPI